MKSSAIFRCDGGAIELPAPGKLLIDRLDGGHLIVNPPRPVWERSELSPSELHAWSSLVAATGRAMIDTLPQIDGGCVNYWEAGNWALNDAALPAGPKNPREHRQVHLHVLGRSRTAAHLSWQWGEAPRFPAFRERDAWSSSFEPLTDGECAGVVRRTKEILREKYGISPAR
jgi:hypothetical protein